MREITDQLRSHGAWVDTAHSTPDPETLRSRGPAPADLVDREALAAPHHPRSSRGRRAWFLAAAAVVVVVLAGAVAVGSRTGDPVSVGGPDGSVAPGGGLVPAGSLPSAEHATRSEAFDYRDPTWQFGPYLPEDADRPVLPRPAALAAALRNLPVVVDGATLHHAGIGHLYEVADAGRVRGEARLAGDTLAWLLTYESAHRASEHDPVCVPARQASAVDGGSPGGVQVVVDAASGEVLVVKSLTTPHG